MALVLGKLWNLLLKRSVGNDDIEASGELIRHLTRNNTPFQSTLDMFTTSMNECCPAEMKRLAALTRVNKASLCPKR